MLSRHSNEPILDRNGKPSEVEPTAFDVKNIFQHYRHYRFLRPDTIAALNNANTTVTRRRMKVLTRKPNNYLVIPDDFYCQPFPNSRFQIYALDLRGERFMKDEGIYNPQQFGDEKLFVHSMLINDTISSLQIGAERAGHNMVWWEDITTSSRFPKETLKAESPAALPVTIRRGDETVSYDYNDSHGAFGVEVPGGFRFFSLEAENKMELDRPTLNKPSFHKKFLTMQQIEGRKLYATHWGLPNLIHLVVCPTQHDIDRRKQLILEVTGGKGCSFVAFNIVPSIQNIAVHPKPLPELYGGGWQRAGHPDLFLSIPLKGGI